MNKRIDRIKLSMDATSALKSHTDAMEVGDSIILKNRKDADTVAYKMKRDGKQVTIEKKTKRWGGTYGFSVLRTK